MKGSWMERFEDRQDKMYQTELKERLEKLLQEYEQRVYLTRAREEQLLNQILTIYLECKRQGIAFEEADYEKKKKRFEEIKLLNKKQQKQDFMSQDESWKGYQKEEEEEER